MSKRIESQKVAINCVSEKVYSFLSNFDNFYTLLPDQVANWQSTGDSCRFEVKGLATIGLRITHKTPFSHIGMIGEGKLPFGFTFDVAIAEIEREQCQVQVVINADMNPFMAVLAEKPLQGFMDALLPRLKQEMEK